jgi:tetratricopeptide (TPR) repeat protein
MILVSRLLLIVALAGGSGGPPTADPASARSYPPAAGAAIEGAAKEASARPADADAAGAYARVLQAWEQWNSAHDEYARAQQLAPKTFDWHYLDACVLQRLGRPAEAVIQLRAALTINPDYLPARLRLAEAAFDAGDVDQSAMQFASVKDPAAEPAVEYGLGRIAAQRGDYAAAVAHFQRAIALFPQYGSAHYALARAYRALGRTDEARAEMEAHATYGALWPAVPDAVLATVTSLREDARALLQRGVKLADAGDVDGAIDAHERALAIDPSLAQAHANLISLYGRAHNWAKAEEHYKAVVAAGVNIADAHYDYGVLLSLQERWDEAADAYRKALALNPLHAQAHNNLGQILERQRKPDDAAREYRLAVESQPTLRIARFNLGRMLIALNRPDEAIADLQPLSEPRDAEAPRYLFALSVAHARAGHKDQAIAWATQAKQLALKYGDTNLAAAIDRNLEGIK